jgi:hypothetical protein
VRPLIETSHQPDAGLNGEDLSVPFGPCVHVAEAPSYVRSGSRLRTLPSHASQGAAAGSSVAVSQPPCFIVRSSPLTYPIGCLDAKACDHVSGFGVARPTLPVV